MDDYARYAVYYAPRGNSDLGKFGNHWLGRDPESGRLLPRPNVNSLTVQHVQQLTRSPSRYGFHGTLKPPFQLHDGFEIDELDQALVKLAASLSRCETGPLKLKRIGRFLALCPTEDQSTLSVLAENCVRKLDRFRQPANTADMEKRRANGLSERQDRYLVEWGYPYVFDEFRFHLTLSNVLDPEKLKILEDRLSGLVRDICRAPFVIDQICLFGDPGNGAPFRLLKRYGLGERDLRIKQTPVMAQRSA